MTNIICNECETVAHCMKNGCVPKQPAPVAKPHEQEPVACGGEQEAPYIGHDCNPAFPDTMKVFCPACCTKFCAIPTNVQKLMLDAGFEPPFTSPPQRTWVGLTDEEINDLVKEFDGLPITLSYAIEAKLKEKNT